LVIYFIIPLLFCFFSFINDILKIAGLSDHFFSDQNFNSYLLLVVAFLFYFCAFKLFNNGKEILPKPRTANKEIQN
jgi:hypothetical protein